MNDYLKSNRRISRNPDTDTRMMIDFLGMETFDVIRSALGGTEIKVPKPATLTETHLLVRRLGWDIANQLCEAFPSAFLYIPKRDPNNSERDRYITQAVMAGVSRNEIALNLNLSTSYLRRLIARLGLSGYVAKEPGAAPVALPAVSNGGLTGLRPSPGISLHPASESRASGL